MNLNNKKHPYLSDVWSSVDALSFSTFKPALLDIIQFAETPLTVGVFGTWGSGKTTLLHMLMNDIANKRNPSFRTVWFTAWKFEQHEALWRAFILRVIDSLYPRKEDGNRYLANELPDENQRMGVERLEYLERSVYETVNWQDEGKWSLDVGELTKQGIRLPFWLAFHLAGLGELGKELGLSPEIASILEREVREHHLNQLTSMEQFEQTFKEAVNLILGKDGRLAIFVDDLDRCLPEKAIEVLEAIKLFLDVPGTVFILGMDREIIRRGIEGYYLNIFKGEDSKLETPINGDIYLQKMIQIPFNLPPMDINGRERFITLLEETLPSDFRLDEVTRQVFARGLLPNPRQVKRALNVFYLLRNIALEQESQKLIPSDVIAWPLLAKTVLIQSQWPELYALWRQYPTLIQTLEEEYIRLPISEDEILRGPQMQSLSNVEADSTSSTLNPQRLFYSSTGGILSDYIVQRQKYSSLAELLRFPSKSGDGRQRARFEGLSRSHMKLYVGLVGAIENTSNIEANSLIDEKLPDIESGDPARIRELISVINEREIELDGPYHHNLTNKLIAASQNINLLPKTRLVASDFAFELGYQPEDLFSFVPLLEEGKVPFYISRYPITNLQYRRFLESADYDDREFWVDFMMFDQNCVQLSENWRQKGWDWLNQTSQKKIPIDNKKRLLPSYWDDKRFGISRFGAPVVGISWYEANAYCKWLSHHWNELDEGKQIKEFSPALIRLPTDQEWTIAAGGEVPNLRFAWDSQEKNTIEIDEIIQRSNVLESGIGQTSPVNMFPNGVSPHGIYDMSGNIWEWQANFYNKEDDYISLRGGSWSVGRDSAKISSRNFDFPNNQLNFNGFRVVIFPI
jgi:formylglycine-generating enzyme required for sulfatase activity